MCVLPFPLLTFTFLIEMNFSLKSLFAIWSLSPQRFHYYFFLSIVSWQYQNIVFSHSDICAVPSACNAVGFFHLTQALRCLHLSSADDDKKNVSYLRLHLFSNVLHQRRRISPRQPMYLLIVGSHYCVKRFAYALHM